jgi:hypothetical protein
LLNEVLRPAALLRDNGSNKVNAILLLTNNNSEEYVSLVSSYIAKTLKSEGAFETVRADRFKGAPSIPGSLNGLFFDYIMIRSHPTRPQNPSVDGGPVPPKRIADIFTMLNRLGMPTNDLERRTFFFDDSLHRHELLRELSVKGYPSHYVFIEANKGSESGYMKGSPDATDYSQVVKAFADGVLPVRQSLAPLRQESSQSQTHPPLQPIKMYTVPSYKNGLGSDEKKGEDEDEANLRRHQEFVAAAKKASQAPRPSATTLFSNLSLEKPRAYKYKPMNGEDPRAFEARMKKMGPYAYKGGKRSKRKSRKFLHMLKKNKKTRRRNRK